MTNMIFNKSEPNEGCPQRSLSTSGFCVLFNKINLGERMECA